MVLVVLHFIIVSAKTLIDSLQNDCDVLEKAVQLSVFVHPNKESHLLEECRSRYAKFRIHQFEQKPRLIQTQVFLPAWSCGKTLAGTGEIGRIVYPIKE